VITCLEINKALNAKIKHALVKSEFKCVEIVASDLSEPIIRPSIKVFLDDDSGGKMNSCMKEQTLKCKVYFFASDLRKYKIENSKVKDLIKNEFLTPLKISDSFVIDIDEIEAEISDTVLILSFDIETLENIPDEILDEGIDYEMMEELDINLESEEE